jgi:hypothetical protein
MEARCLAQVCALAPSTPDVWVRPRPRDPGCFAKGLGAILAGTTFAGRATLTFLVGPDGRTGAFQFDGPVPRGLYEPIIAATHRCAYEPATRNGQPTPSWIVQPIKVQ